MASRVRWLLLAGVVLVVVAGASSLVLRYRVAPPFPNPTAHIVLRTAPRLQLPGYGFDDKQLQQFLADARHAESISDPLKRCLAYPDPPGVNWPSAVTMAYCHYRLDPAISKTEVRQLIQSGHAAKLDKRLAEIMQDQLTKPGAQGVLDRTYIIDFRDSADETRALIDAWKRQSPNSPFALAASGWSYAQMAQDARGSDYASKTPQSQFEDMGRILRRAREDLDRSVTLEPKLTPSYVIMINIGAMEDDTNYSASAVRRGLSADPADYAIYEHLIGITQPKWGGTVALMRRAINEAEQRANGDPLFLLLKSEYAGGEAYVENCGCDPAAERDIYRTLFADGAPRSMLLSAGWGAQNRNVFDLAVIYRSEALRFDPSDTDLRIARAFDLPMLSQHDWAHEEGESLVRLKPQDENAYDVRGLAYQSSGDNDRAAQDYQQALRINPDDSWTLNQLGYLYVNTNHDWDKGWKIAERLIQIDPNNPQGWFLRASIQKRQPREGLKQTVADFTRRFGNGQEKSPLVYQLEALLNAP